MGGRQLVVTEYDAGTPLRARVLPRDQRPLVAACAGFALLSFVLVPLTLTLGWDEIVYASRFGPYAPATPFSAPRTRGVPLLIAPVAAWSDSVVLLRVWLTVLATGALYLGFRPWIRVLAVRPAAVGVAAGLYGTLWFALFYAGAAMPNHYTAMGAVAAVGLFLRTAPTPLTYAGIGAGLAVATLMRPNDGAAVAAPLLLVALLGLIAPRSWARVLAVLGGVVAGALPWVIEAYVRFGGVRERLVDASDVQGGLRPLAAITAQFTAVDGPLLCRPCGADQIRVVALEWWILLPVLVGFGLWAAGRSAGSGAGCRQSAAAPSWLGAPTRRSRTCHSPAPLRGAPKPPRATRGALWLAVVVGVCAALPYLLLVPYGAPRFLLPSHALLALPAAVGLLALVDRARASRVLAAALAVVLVGHLAVQLPLAHGNGRIQAGARGDWARVTAVLREQGVRAPCVLQGNTSVIPLAYVSGCAADPRSGPERPTALVLRNGQPPPWARDWRSHPVPDTYAPGWTVLVPPRTAIRNTPTDMRS
ncbi:hypothetical protein [Streptomyces sp. NPDC021622]|uniref:hypothetical protein n=1 Tax=Streptomyces sp. NPDC021622 TaxID=3155013 RepID=UPI0033DC1E8F